MKSFIYLILAALCLSGVSCRNTDEDSLPEVVQPPVLPEGYVRMQITVPGLSKPETYALSAVDECAMGKVDVLVFNKTDGKFLCHAVGDGIADADDGTNGNKKTFTVDLKDAEAVTDVYVMIIANAHSVVEAAVGTSITDATTTEEALTKLEFTSSDKWNVGGDFTPFSMWGMTEVDLSDAGDIQPVTLMRSVAKIDVGVKFNGETAQGLGTTFTLESVAVYNTLDKGYVAPSSGNYSASEVKATAVSIPASSGANGVLSYQSATGTDGFSADKFSCTNAIYIAEHAVGSLAGRASNACLVIGGSYQGGAVTYYRVDFIGTDKAYLPVLRNHRYKVNITGVGGNGYATAQEAFDAKDLNLIAAITVTDESLSSYAYNGQYALGVSKNAFTFDRAARTGQALQITTSYEKGYKAVAASVDNWLTITAGATTSTVTGGSPVTLTFSLATNSGSDRSGTITVTSGLLTKVITVTQKSTDAFSVAAALAQYPNTGVQQTLSVTSAYNWYVKVKDDPDNIIESFDTNGAGSGAFNFKLTSGTGYYGSLTATLTFYSPTSDFSPVDRVLKLEYNECYPSTHHGWAGSNIYWDGTKLTFADTGITDKQNYQGVYFQWGSLYGLAASGSADIAWSTDQTVYKPKADQTGYEISSTGYAWTAIARVDDTNITSSPPSGKDAKDRAYLYEITDDSKGVGDICKYLTKKGLAPGSPAKKWRMPTSNEFNASSGNYTSSGTYGFLLPSLANGTWENANKPGKTKSGTGSPFFPASGFRRHFDGALVGAVGTSGYYWSSSPSYTSAHNLYFDNSSISPNNINNHSFGFSVRCVQE
ncbi:MAG: hypothetical protein LBJ39_06680 [Tannerellaceae bacterium]|jgi:hypothetical protein|nr:hypothetical protein [Tannerellaceae bacterium]